MNFSFNGVTKEYIEVLHGFQRPMIAPIEHDLYESRQNGVIVRKARLAPIELSVPVVIKHRGRSLEDVKTELNGWLFHQEAKRLVFEDDPDRNYLARLLSVELEEYEHFAKGAITFYLDQPYRFGAQRELEVTPTASEQTITGQVETPWTSETTFSNATSHFTLETSQGMRIFLHYRFISGDLLHIDYEKRKVTLNGQDLAAAISLSSHWDSLKPGAISLNASEPTTVTYTERYY